MNISFTQDQENFIQSKLSAGKYQSTQEIFEIAFLLLEEYERSESEWASSVREKIKAAIEISKQEQPIDGENFVAGILQRLEGV